jgi:hypothetical protein
MGIAESAPVAIAFTREELTILNGALSRHLSYVGTTTDEKQHEAVSELLLRVQDYWIAQPQPLRVAVVLEGGLVTSIVADIPVEATTIDYDVEGISLNDPSYCIPKVGCAHWEEALRYTQAADVNPAFIDQALAAPLCMDSAHGLEEQVERWIACTFPDAIDDHCWHFSASFAFDGDMETVSGLIPAPSSSRAHELVSEMLNAICGEVSKLDVALQPPVSALIWAEVG